ncbi:MAG: FkbM family methyltransferase [Paracoccaceae bacterium]
MKLRSAGAVARENARYRRLSDRGRADYYREFAKMFKGKRVGFPETDWTVDVAGRPLKLPLRPAHGWMDWDSACAVLGHDTDIKDTYRALWEGPERPEIFLDVGANYGTHSLLFLAAGIETISFEPNPTCRAYYDASVALNGFEGRWEAVAVGAAPGEIELVFPAEDTWLGTTDPRVIETLGDRMDIERVRVPLVPLDSYQERLGPVRPMAMKIDVEGAEIAVLDGARGLIAAFRPVILFESNEIEDRPAIFGRFAALGYGVSALPWSPDAPGARLPEAAFCAAGETNFLAAPAA